VTTPSLEDKFLSGDGRCSLQFRYDVGIGAEENLEAVPHLLSDLSGVRPLRETQTRVAVSEVVRSGDTK